MSAFGEQVQLLAKQEALQKELEECSEDMERMTQVLDELDRLTNKARINRQNVFRGSGCREAMWCIS